MSKSALEAKLEAAGPDLVKTAIARAKAGDSASLRMCLDRLLPLAEKSLDLRDLPKIESVGDVVQAIGFVTRAVAEGRIKPSEGSALVGLINSLKGAFDSVELAERLAVIERRLEGSIGLPDAPRERMGLQ